MLVLLSIIMTSSAVMAQECKPSGRITGRQPPPGKCNTENDSECCVPGQNYTTYWCSPPVTNHTEAVLNLSGFDQGQDGGGPARCDNKYHPDDTPVAALSTGWFNETSRCGDVILITGNGGRTVKAVVVDECNSYVGCDVNNDYQPPCPYNVVAASKAVWDALGVPENSPLYGVMNVTWSPTNEKDDTTRARLVHQKKVIIAVVVIVILLVSMIVWLVVYSKTRRRDRKNQLEEEQWENSLMFLSDAPKRFTYKQLKLATDNFNEQRKLGAGGFGSVFEGSLNDRGKTCRVAVKRLDYFKQGKKEFMAEVKTTGSTHHFNLVKLIGFCAEEEHRLLVYEYMSNGSLDKWVFRENKNYSLDWNIRKKIILHICKGLSYLHEDCNSKILHLDIKPQNILLDPEFNAKLADFGLAKLIDKEESFAATQMRGTRGYLAPEWLSRKITEKVDVYSCGIVMLEVAFQRRNFDLQNQESPTLIEIVRSKLEADRLFEVIEECCGDEEMMRNNIEEVEKMIKLAIWCLQIEPTRRPSMSTVVKVLEGAIALEPIIDSSFANSISFSETTSGDISSNATMDISSMAFPR